MIIIYNFNILYYIKIKTNSKKMVKLFCYEKKKKNYKHPSAILFRQTIFVQSNATIRLKNRYIFFKFKLLRSPKQLFYLIWRIFSSPLVYQNLSIFIESIKLYLKYSALIFCIILTISYMINRWYNNLQFFRDSS